MIRVRMREDKNLHEIETGLHLSAYKRSLGSSIPKN